jgi:hypothetical protein
VRFLGIARIIDDAADGSLVGVEFISMSSAATSAHGRAAQRVARSARSARA